MSWESAFAGEREQAARTAMPAAPATLGEIWSTTWRASGLDTVFGQGDAWQEAQGELRSAIEGAAGMSAAEIAKAQGRSLKAVDWSGASWQDSARELAELSAGLTPEQQEKVKPFLDVPARARRLAAERERQASDVADRTYGLGGHAVGFLAGLTRAAVDPVNIGTMFVGGPFAGGVARMLGREFLLGAGVQAVQEPFVQAGRAELGLESGLGRAASNVLEAGLGNAGLAGLFRGAGWLMRRAAAPAEVAAARAGEAATAPAIDLRLNDASAQPVTSRSDIPPPLRELSADDLDAAARLAERDELIDALAPEPNGPGRMAHAETVEDVIARMETAGSDLLAAVDAKVAELELRLREERAAQAQTAGGEVASPPARPVRRRPPSERAPVSLGRYIAENGGLRIDEGGDVRYLGLNQMFVPGAGMVGRINGRVLDTDLEHELIAEGYLRPHDPDQPSRDVRQEVYDALAEEASGRQPLYRAADQARLAGKDMGRVADIDARWRDEIQAETESLRTRIVDAGMRVDDFAPELLEQAADRLVRGIDDDWSMALERVVMARELGDDASPTALAAAEDMPDWEIADAIFGRDAQQDSGRAGDGGGQGGKPGPQGGSGAPGEAVPGAGGARAAQGGREGDPALDLARLAGASDDPAQFKARLADLRRDLDAAGGDIQLELPDGAVSARKLLEQIRDDAAAVDALKGCLGQGGEGTS